MRFDATPETPENIALPEAGGAESGALNTSDPELLHVIRLWPSLSDSVRRAVLALVDAAPQ